MSRTHKRGTQDYTQEHAVADSLAVAWIAAGKPPGGPLGTQMGDLMMEVATNLATHYHLRSKSCSLTQDDMRQCCVSRIMSQVDKWLPSKGMHFRNWLFHNMRNNLLTALCGKKGAPLYGPGCHSSRVRLGMIHPSINLDECSPECDTGLIEKLVEHGVRQPIEHVEIDEDITRMRDLEVILIPTLSSNELLAYSLMVLNYSGATTAEMAGLRTWGKDLRSAGDPGKSADNCIQRIRRKADLIQQYLVGEVDRPQPSSEWCYGSRWDPRVDRQDRRTETRTVYKCLQCGIERVANKPSKIRKFCSVQCFGAYRRGRR